MSLFSWLRSRPSTKSRRWDGFQIRPTAPRFRPRLEALEDRELPSTYYAATASDLIADINAANKTGGANTIVLTAPTTSPYVLASVNNSTDGNTVLPVIAKGDTLTIQTGNGSASYGDTIDASKAGRLFDVAQGASLTLANVTLQNGFVPWVPGATAAGGAIYNHGTLVLSQVMDQNNTAGSGYPYNAYGGGIWSNGSLTVENSCVFQGNSANGYRDAYGGAICIVGGTADITSSTFGNFTPSEWNSAYTPMGGKAYGGAVYVSGGTVTMSGDTVGLYSAAAGFSPTNNAQWTGQGTGYGGGLCVTGGTLILSNDSITGNGVGAGGTGYGGGIYVSSPGKLYLDSYTKANTQNNHTYLGYISNIVGPYTFLLQIGSFTASPNPITAGSSLTLTASNIAPATPGATITQVTFYYFDSSGAKHVLGNGKQTSAGVWTLTVKANLAPGAYTLYAQAEDSDGLFGPAAALTLTVQ
jgi:hypothetical protein